LTTWLNPRPRHPNKEIEAVSPIRSSALAEIERAGFGLELARVERD
jgi:hypothetical protein